MSLISHIYHWIADSNLTWKSPVIIASPFLLFIIFCMILVLWIPWPSYVVWFHQSRWISRPFLRVNAGIWTSKWAIWVVFVVPSWLRILICKGSLGVSSACCLYPFRTLIIEVPNSFGFCQYVVLDAVSCSLCVDDQNCKDFVSCPFDWWCLWCFHFIAAGKILGLINRVNIFVSSL